jgi:hypothetical protein
MATGEATLEELQHNYNDYKEQLQQVQSTLQHMQPQAVSNMCFMANMDACFEPQVVFWRACQQYWVLFYVCLL